MQSLEFWVLGFRLYLGFRGWGFYNGVAELPRLGYPEPFTPNRKTETSGPIINGLGL